MTARQGITSAATVFAILALAVAGCGADRSREDAGDLTGVCKDAQQGNCIDKSPKRVIANHNHFPNITTGCDGYGHRYFVTTRAAADPVIINDPDTCPIGVVGLGLQR